MPRQVSRLRYRRCLLRLVEAVCVVAEMHRPVSARPAVEIDLGDRHDLLELDRVFILAFHDSLIAATSQALSSGPLAPSNSQTERS
jgi:hypothetical protein